MAYKKSNPNGQTTMSASEPVVLASDHSDVKITLDSEAVVLGAGSAAIGKLAANSGVDIGDVDVLTVNGVAPAFGTGLRGATVQRVTIATDDSVPVTNAGITTIAGAVSGTEMQVDVLTMPTVTVTATNLDVQSGGADLATSTQAGAIQTAVEIIDNAVYVDDADWTDSTSSHLLVGGLYQSAPQTVTDGDVAPFNMTANGALHVAQQGTVTVSGTVDLGATDNAVLDAIAASVAAIDTDTTTVIGHLDGVEGLLTTIDADTSILSGLVLATQADDVVNTSDGLQVTNFNMVFDGTTWDRARGDAANGTLVNLGANNDVTVTGTVDLGATDNAVLDAIAASVAAIDTDTSTIITNTGATTTALQIMDDWDNGASDGASVSGDVAHDGVDAGEPVKVGGKALDLGATPTAVAANDRTNAAFMRNGVQFVLGGHPNIVTKNVQITDADGAATDLDLLGAIGAGTAVVVTKVSVVADNANTVDVSCRIGFGATNTPAADAAGVVLFHPGIAPGSGVIEGSGAGIIGIGASGEELRATTEDPVTGSISIVVTYFTVAIG